MRNQIIIYGLLILGFIIYNLFFQVADDRTNTIINILYGSVLFLYIAYLAWKILKNIGTRK